MGDGIDLPGALKRLVLLAPFLVGCVDFVEPDLADIGAPAVIEATIRITDRGVTELEALLAPGLDDAGLRRGVTRDTLFALGRAVVPDSVAHNGSRRYRSMWESSPDAVAEPVTFSGPFLAGPIASPPEVTWTGARRVGPDSIDVVRGEDVAFEIERGPGTVRPVPDVQQWFLRLEGDAGAFNVSADGEPPDSIRIPASWVPAGSEVAVQLIFAQSAVTVNMTGDYIGLIRLDIRLHWTLRMIDSQGTRP